MILYLKEGKKDAIMSFGEKLSYFKKRKGLSDHEIGLLIGASDKAVYGFEQGVFKPWQPETYEILAEVFGCTAEELENDSAKLNILQDNRKEEKAMKKESSNGKALTEGKKTVEQKPFGEKLHDLRTEKGMSLTQISEAVGIKKGAYQGFEYKNSRPRDIKVYDKLAEVLGCDVAYLTEGDERFSSQKPAEKKAVNRKSAPKQEQKAPQDSEQITEAEQAVKEPAQDPNTNMETVSFGDRLSNLRVDKDIKQQDMSDRLGIAISAYRAMEKRDDRPGTMTEYENLAEILGCDVAYLTEGDERFSPQKDAVEKPMKESTEKPAPAEQMSKGVEESIKAEEVATLPEKLVSIRKEKKLSQKAAAEAIGVHSNTLLRWEKGEIHPSENMIQKLSDFYGEDLSGFKAPAEESTEKIAPEKEEKDVPSIPSTEPFGKRLSTLRKAKNLTLAQAADKIGITQSAYKSMEYRNFRPRDIKVYNKLAKVLGCDVEYLKEGDKRFEKKAEKKVIIIPPKKKAEKKTEVRTEAVKAPQPTDLGEIEENIPIDSVEEPDVPAGKSSASSEVIKLVSRLSVLLASDEIGKDEKDAVMVALNRAYWR